VCVCVCVMCVTFEMGARWGRTEGVVAAVGSVAQPKLSIDVPAPALDARVVLRRAATFNSQFKNNYLTEM